MSEDRDLFALTHRLQTTLIQVKNVMEYLSYTDSVGISEPAEHLASGFSPAINLSLFDQLFARCRQGDFSDFPDVSVCSRADLRGARSGYVIESNVIYVAEDFAAVSSEAQIATVLLQEIFNAMEARVRHQGD